MDDKDQTAFARQLRKDSTDAERALWAMLRSYRFAGLKFRRQEPIGPYIGDFVCFEKKIVIEVDGGQHKEEAVKQTDSIRTVWLQSQGFQVLRFWNNDVLKNMDGVFEVVRRVVESPSPLILSHKGRGSYDPLSLDGREPERGCEGARPEA